MYERTLMREELDDILRSKRETARLLGGVMGRVDDPAVRDRLAEVLAVARRHIALSERLVEIFS